MSGDGTGVRATGGAGRRAGSLTGGRADARRLRLLRAVGRERPRPRVRIELGPSVPVWVLRGLQVVAGLFCTAVVATSEVQWFLTVPALAVGLFWPEPMLLALLPLSWGVGLALLPLGAVSPQALLLLLGLHLYVVLGTAAGQTPPSARVEWAALAPAAVRFVVLQAAAQALAWGAAGVRTLEVAAPWLPILAAAAIAVVAWVASGRLLGAPENEGATRRAAREDREPNRGDDGWSYHLDA
jgi:hypothetical protein